MPVPRNVSLGEREVRISWSDGHESIHSNRSLRESCPCAVCQGEPPAIGGSPVIRLMVAAPEGLAARSHKMVGRYAISFSWSDGHSSGIYPYDYLLASCECAACTKPRG